MPSTRRVVDLRRGDVARIPSRQRFYEIATIRRRTLVSHIELLDPGSSKPMGSAILPNDLDVSIRDR